MSVIKKYESRGRLENVEYITFFCNMPDDDGTVFAAMFMRDDGLPSGETLWCLAGIKVPTGELDKFAVAPEEDDQDYCAGEESVSCASFDEMLEQLRFFGLEEEDRDYMISAARKFFGF